MKVGLYSITYSGTWYKGEFLSIKEMIRKAKALGYEGVEIDLKRPHGFPLDLDEKARTEIREFAESEGIDYIDEQAPYALEYMRKLIQSA